MDYKSDAMCKGSVAFQLEQEISDNPYPLSSQEAYDWLSGWAYAANMCVLDWAEWKEKLTTERLEEALEAVDRSEVVTGVKLTKQQKAAKISQHFFAVLIK